MAVKDKVTDEKKELDKDAMTTGPWKKYKGGK